MRRRHRVLMDVDDWMWIIYSLIFFMANVNAEPDVDLRLPASLHPFDKPSALLPDNHQLVRLDDLANCIKGRLFLCYAYEHLNIEMPEWLQPECAPCKADVCAFGAGTIGPPESRLAVFSVCRPRFCTADQVVESNRSVTDCILPVTMNDGNDQVLFPFNLCTREMVAAGECGGKQWSTTAYIRAGIPLTSEYFVQCDAGFTIPGVLVDAIEAAKQAGVMEADQPKATCVPSLQLAAGYASNDEQRPFTQYKYDVADPLNITYCENGGRPPDGTCEPLPICKEDGKIPHPIFGSTQVLGPPGCDKACEYQHGATYEDCVFLDISEPDGRIPFFTARRALSGPYAVFMDLEENLKADLTTEKPASDDSNSPSPDSTTNGTKGALSALHFHEIVLPELKDGGNSRTRRQSDGPKKIRYPRCIDVDGLAKEDLARVEADVMLNCDKNIFVLFRNGDKSGLSIKPPKCQGSNDTRICTNRHPPSTAPPIVAKANPNPLTNEMLVYIGIGVCSFVVVLIVGGVLLLRRRSRREEIDEEVEVEKPVTKQKKKVVDPVSVPLLKNDLAGVIYELRTVDISGGHMKHWHKMLCEPQRPTERVDGVYDLVGEGFALRIDRARLKPFVREDKPPVFERIFDLLDTAPSSPKRKKKQDKPGEKDQRPPLSSPWHCYEKKDFDPATARDATTVATEIITTLGSERWLSESDYLPSYTPHPDDLRVLCEHLTPIMKAYRGVARLSGKSIVAGDIHGNFNDLWRIIHAWLSDEVGGGPGQNIIFLGDIVDRGRRQIECWTLVLAYKTLYPNQVHVIRGNHEEAETCGSFRYWLGYRLYAKEVINGLVALFAWMPVIGLIDDRILCMHGMITAALTRKYLREGWDPGNERLAEMTKNMRWNDPSSMTDFFLPNTARCYGYLCGPLAIEQGLEELGVEFILRGHETMTNGVQRFLKYPLATVFSTSFYDPEPIDGVLTPSKKLMKNLGAIVYVDPGKNAIKPIFIVNINDNITTQQQLNDRLEEGWKKNNYPEAVGESNDKTICLSTRSSASSSSYSAKMS